MLLSLVQHPPDPPSWSGRDFRLLSDEGPLLTGSLEKRPPYQPEVRRGGGGTMTAGSQKGKRALININYIY